MVLRATPDYIYFCYLLADELVIRPKVVALFDYVKNYLKKWTKLYQGHSQNDINNRNNEYVTFSDL